jgi:hypothetical protein
MILNAWNILVLNFVFKKFWDVIRIIQKIIKWQNDLFVDKDDISVGFDCDAESEKS